MTSIDRPYYGIGLRLLSGVLMGGMLASVKAIGESIPLGQIVFFRSFFALLPLVIFLWLRNEFPSGLATKRPFDHFLRAGFGALALFSSFAAVARLNLAEAVLIAQLSPVFMSIAAVYLLSEKITIWRMSGIAVGFCGVLVLVWPELHSGLDSDRTTGYVIGVVAAALSALALIMVRRLTRTENPGAIAIYFVLASMAGAILTIPSGWVIPSGPTLFLLIASGLFGGFGHIAMTLAFRYAEASRLAPFEYVALLWPLLADVLIFRVPLSSSFLLAAPLVLAGAGVAAKEGGIGRLTNNREQR